ncbi:MAG: acyl carrier protein [Phaeodactylibacter sp.]|uniref:acyl carrier protein n=1 Tax=Phaeodactylibacter sp. TaxID=1940289 RepID=UPI0032EC5604
MENFKTQLREYLLNDLSLPLQPDELQDDTLLVSDRIMDSISSLMLVEYLEKNFAINFEPHEVSAENLDSINIIEAFVNEKLARAKAA